MTEKQPTCRTRGGKRSAPPSPLVRLAIHSRSSLQACVMPGIAGGGWFVPTHEAYALNDPVCLVVSLFGEPAIPVLGRVVWVSPAQAAHHRMQGIGVQLDDDENAARLRDATCALLPQGRDADALSHTF